MLPAEPRVQELAGEQAHFERDVQPLLARHAALDFGLDFRGFW